jgi:hypothetical protein
MKSKILSSILLSLPLWCAACGSKDAAPRDEGSPISRMDASAQLKGSRIAVDQRTMEARRLAGSWRGVDGADAVQASFGADGSFSMTLLRGRALVDEMHGRWRWTEDRRLEGDSEGAIGRLQRYGRWKASFSGDQRMNIAGSNGAIIALTKGSAR